MSDDIDRHVLRKYQVLGKLGRGAYGIVWKAVDKESQKTVALKKCFDAFACATDAQRTYREIRFLQELDGHRNIIQLVDVLRADNDKDVYMVLTHMVTDLHMVNRLGILQEVHRQFIIYQVCCAIKFMHSGMLIHRDLKPSNILLNDDCEVRLCDFGLARSIEGQDNARDDLRSAPVMTDYVATRWYRAPEILLGSAFYTVGVDLWSIGCIIGELYTGKPIIPGTSTMNQLERIVSVTGSPSSAEVAAVRSPFAETMLASLGTAHRTRTISRLIPNANPQAADMMGSLLQFSPLRRTSAKELCAHAYLEDFQDSDDEQECGRVIRLDIDDDKRFDVGQYREMLYRHMYERKRRQRRGTE